MYNPDSECSNVVENIKTLCRLKSMSINMTAKKAELSVSALNDLVNGKTKPQVYTLFKLCNALEVPIEELLSDAVCVGDSQGNHGDDENRRRLSLSREEKELLFCYRYLPEWKKSLLVTLVDMLEKYDPAERDAD